MKYPAKPPKISIIRLILTVTLIAAIILFLATMLTKSHAAVVKITHTDISVIFQSPDTTGYKNIEYRYYNGIKHYFLRLDSLTAKQIIEAISKYRHIPVDYRGKRLAKQDRCFDGTISLDGNIKDIITVLNRLNIYVKYDGKRIIAGE